MESEMKLIDEREFIWAQKYRPQTVDDLIFPDKIKNKLKGYIKKNEIPNLAFWGTIPGSGKTSATNAIIKDLDCETLWINGSRERGIEAVRANITNFTSTNSIDGRIKVVIIDEADQLTTDAQKALRGIIEEVSISCRFIFTGNYKDNMIDPLIKRFTSYDLDDIYQHEFKQELGLQIFHRLMYILSNEEVEYNPADLQTIITNMYPSTRDMVMLIQDSVFESKLEVTGVMDNLAQMTKAFELVKANDFSSLRLMLNDVTMVETFITQIFKNIDKYFTVSSIPHVIVLLSDYQDSARNAKNPTITVTALFTKIMGDSNINLI